MDYQVLIINLKKKILSARRLKVCTRSQAEIAWYSLKKIKMEKSIGENLSMMSYFLSYSGNALTYSSLLEEFIHFEMSVKEAVIHE